MSNYQTLTRKELLVQLQKSEEAKIKYVNKYLEQEEKWNILRLMLAKISHEFKTPLNSIIGFSNLLRNYISEDKAFKFLDNISISSNHMLDLIQDLIDITKAQYMPMELNYSLFNTKQVIEDIIHSYPNINFRYTLVNIEIEADYFEVLQKVRASKNTASE